VTVLGSGFLPLAPGTWGALVAVVAFAVLWSLATALGAHRPVVEAVLVAGVLGSSWFSIRWGGWAIARFGDSDPSCFVLDEFAGQWLALLALPAAYSAGVWAVAAAAGLSFFLFRVFDVIKPPPARQAESLPAGWGIITDYLVAGLYANLVGQVLWRLASWAGWLPGAFVHG
jgi:phosphatidylglycerophosphatase A